MKLIKKRAREMCLNQCKGRVTASGKYTTFWVWLMEY